MLGRIEEEGVLGRRSSPPLNLERRDGPNGRETQRKGLLLLLEEVERSW